MDRIVIAIEGLVASGKSSICKELIKMIDNCILIDGSAIYRGIIYAIKKSGIDLSNMLDSNANLNPFDIMNKLNVEFKIENNETVIYIDGEKIANEDVTNIQNDIGVSSMWSKVDNTALYCFANKIIQKYRENYNLVVAGRDLSKIYPDMTAHIFITASIDERVNRRYNQYDGKYSKEELRDIIIKRDEMHNKISIIDDEKHLSVDVTDCNNANESAKRILNRLIDFNLISKDILV